LNLGVTNVDIKAEVLDIFAAKFMSFLRNPYSVKKVLNNIGGVRGFLPTNPKSLEQFKSVLAGKKPQQEYLCSQLKITPVEYREWLAALFMMLDRHGPEQINLMESTVKGLYEDPSNDVFVYVHNYADEHLDKRCLLSDLGYSIPCNNGDHLAFSFNLCSNAFITYVFADIAKIYPKEIRPEILDLYRQRHKNVQVLFQKNDLNALANYNRNVVYQCHCKVYSSSRTIYGLPGCGVTDNQLASIMKI
jgi:hypothetical protein